MLKDIYYMTGDACPLPTFKIPAPESFEEGVYRAKETLPERSSSYRFEEGTHEAPVLRWQASTMGDGPY